MSGTLENLSFDVPEILSLIGLVQCVYILVYMSFRAGGWGRGALPFSYFLVLGLAFFVEFAGRFIAEAIPFYQIIDWGLWFMGPPLSVLLMIQIVRITEPPSIKHFRVLGLLPLAFILAGAVSRAIGDSAFYEWLTLAGILAGVASLMAMWGQRPVLANLITQPGGRDRYWLILTLVVANLCFLATMLLSLTPIVSEKQIMVMRSIWGLGFIYLAGTSLFRIYPQALRLVDRSVRPGELSEDEHKIAGKIENLLTLEKIYQEPTCNRVSLAKELGVSETMVSRIINQHFGKSLPQLLNDHRIQDAKRLLQETDAPVKTIAEEVGFNSIASFNRVFRDAENISPGQFREACGKKA